jgi:hypothetical protein
MVQIDTLYELGRQRQRELLREAELDRLAATHTPSSGRVRVAAALTALAQALAAPGTTASQRSPRHAQ